MSVNFGPDEYRSLIDTIALNETHRLYSEAWRALQAAERMSSEAIDQMRIEVNVICLFAVEHEWDTIVSMGATMFSPTHVPYLLQRATDVQRPLFAVRYAIAAWLAQRRKEYATLATDLLLAAIAQYQQSDDVAERFIGLRRSLILVYGIARAAGKIDVVRERAWELVRDLRPPFDVLRAEAAQRLVDDKDTSTEILEPLGDVIADLMKTLAAGDNDLVRGLSVLGKRVDSKLKRPRDKEWDERLGESLEIWIAHHPEPMAKGLGAQEAAAAFARAGNEKKALEMQLLTKKSIAEQEPVTIEIPLEGADDFHSHLRSVFRSLYNDDGADGAIRMLSVGPHIIPEVATVRAHQEEREREGIGSFLQMVQSHTISADHRIVDHVPAGQQQSVRGLQRDFGIHVDGHAKMAMSAFVQELVVSGEVTLDDAMSFFGGTWFGLRETASSRSEVDLLVLLRPGMRAWFDIATGLRSGDDLILVGDSLVLKVETALRKMARCLSVSDVKTVSRNGKIVDEHAGLEMAGHPLLKAALGDDLYEFLTYVLDRADEGFRDRLAHGAALPHEYSYENIDLVVLVLLRLAGRTVRQDATKAAETMSQ